MPYYTITVLDIKGLLTQLPDDIHLYTHLKILICGNNRIIQLNNLPPGLKELECYYNPFIYDFEPTLENIKKYNASNANISTS